MNIQEPNRKGSPKAVILRAVKFAFVSLCASLALSGWKQNPAIEVHPDWADARTEALFNRACTDCHSNATRWPGYAYFAPFSWPFIHNVREGRSIFNISEADPGLADKAASEIRSGSMPTASYLRNNPAANLSEEEKAALIEGLTRMYGDADAY